MYWKTCEAWHSEKLYLIKYVGFLEMWTEREKKWELDNPGVIETVEGAIESARKPLGVARKETPYLHWLDVDMGRAGNGHAIASKKVRFGEDVAESSSRAMGTFSRKSAAYVPGRWTAPEDEGWVATSFFHDSEYGSVEVQGHED